ncbi:MAG: sulfatase modifying factor 1 [Verrucomicrobiales bacterium]
MNYQRRKMNDGEIHDVSQDAADAGAAAELPIRLFPLRPFLESLAGDATLSPGPRDYRRLSRAFRGETKWDLAQVRVVVVSLLARGDEDADRLERRFDRFFASDSAGEIATGFKKEPELEAALSDLKSFSDRYLPIVVKPAAMEPPPLPAPEIRENTEKRSPRGAERRSVVERPTESGCDFSLTEIGAPPAKRGVIELPPLDFTKSIVFSAARLGGPPEPILRRETLDELADSMGYFRSPITGRNLDIEATVDGTIRAASPQLVFHRRQQVCSLLILIDRRSEDFQWNGVPLELAIGMESRGVPVRVGWFEGLPEIYHDESGMRRRLEDLEGSRRGLFVLLFTDGRSFHSENARFALERLANWPRLAWLDPREARFHDASSALAAIHRIPVYAAGNEGLLRVARDFLGERGAAPTGQSPAARSPSILDRGGLPLGTRITGILGDALTLAEELSVLPVDALASRGLIGALRRERHPHVAPEAIGRLCALPGSQVAAEGVRLSGPVGRWLRDSLEARAEDNLKLKKSLSDFYLKLLEELQPEETTVAHCAWQAWRQWILLNLDPNRADAGELRVLLAENSPTAGWFDSSAGRQSLPVSLSDVNPAQAMRLREAGLEIDFEPSVETAPVLTIVELNDAVRLVAPGVRERLKGFATIGFDVNRPAPPVAVPRLELTSVLRELLDNTVESVRLAKGQKGGQLGEGPGRIDVRLIRHDEFAGRPPIARNNSYPAGPCVLLEIQGNGVQFPQVYGAPLLDSMIEHGGTAGLAMVRDFSNQWKGLFEIMNGANGGSIARLFLPVEGHEYRDGEFRPVAASSVDRHPSQIPSGMVLIPTGPFKMGDSWKCGDGDELPAHEVELSEFFLAEHPVTFARWREVRDWAVENGYEFANKGKGGGDDHPVQSIDWHDAVKWCNALSEKEGRTPVYRVDPTRKGVFREGRLDLGAECVDWDADGYRLPTEAEWEKAARGGFEGQQYPWQSHGKDYEKFISPELANYNRHSAKGTTPIGAFEPNEYGLHDMAGNVYEWCWDWDDSNWYGKAAASKKDTRGPEAGGNRAVRGGSWSGSAGYLRCAYRDWRHPQGANDFLGFRLARGQTVARSGAGSGKGARDERPARARVRFAPPEGRVEPDVSPAEARVILREASGARATPGKKPYDLAPGEWHLRAQAKGYFEGRVTFEIAAGTRYRMELRLRREPPEGFQYIPPGPFLMGDHSKAGYDNERPRHTVAVSGFYLDRHPVTRDLWRRVHAWALKHGYEFDHEGKGKGKAHPAQTVNWYDAVKWCNARSEMENLPPAYFLDDAWATVFRKGEKDIAAEQVRWRGEGYRLPTEAEWEKAARGGLEGHHFPWPSTAKNHEAAIGENNANYGFEKNGTTPVGGYAANGFGLHDMAGNVYEWVWDRWDKNCYEDEASKEADCKGPESGEGRAVRGGFWYGTARHLRCAYRNWGHPQDAGDDLGFRLARGQAVERSEAGAGKEARDE